MSMKTEPRAIHEIAREIIEDWPKAGNQNHPAGAYCVPMLSLVRITDRYGYDDAKSIVLYFLANASGWRGEKARAIKKELKALCSV